MLFRKNSESQKSVPQKLSQPLCQLRNAGFVVIYVDALTRSALNCAKILRQGVKFYADYLRTNGNKRLFPAALMSFIN
jgi:hypothetical protein